ncbi:hypothetical protein CDL15_Pgr020427 [Punica granatum]|uniref:AAA+ ATPase domain-containing protein n=1 Tax=Punica granatum TaxID=22663 RepID=A0A218VWL4_PUNGR|nr:hypothetical protein CDL15_Pgr020427 [Punica granatum]
MACASVICNHGFLKPPGVLGVHGEKPRPLIRYSSFRYSSFKAPLLGFCDCCCKFQCGLSCNWKLGSSLSTYSRLSLLRVNGGCRFRPGLCCRNEIGQLDNRSSGFEDTYVEKRGKGNRRKFSLRLRPRLWLLSMRAKRVSIRSILNDIGTFLQRNTRKVTISTLVSLVLGLCYVFLKVTAVPSPKVVPYSDLVTSLQSAEVTKVLFEEGSRLVYYNTHSSDIATNDNVAVEKMAETSEPSENVAERTGKSGVSRIGKLISLGFLGKRSSQPKAKKPAWQYCTRKIVHDEKYLLTLMRDKGITYSSAPQSIIMSIRGTLITIISLWIPLTPMMWLLYRQFSAANSPARKRQANNQIISFDDVEGVDSAKVELMEIVLCLQGGINYKRIGAKLPTGVLLVGPPGTGKTLLARAVAGEAGVPFFSASASEFVELFVGRGAARIRDLFNAARKCAPSIIFIDELDALLTEMDGFQSDTKVIVLAATNRPEALDPALCRPGRFSRKVLVGEPDEEGRKKILGVHLRGVPLEEDRQLICDLVASLTPGLVGADLANIVNESALLAARRGGETVTREDIMEAVERAKFGINDKQLRPSTISRELGKLFPWVPSLMGRSDTKQDGLEGPMGYQTLS